MTAGCLELGTEAFRQKLLLTSVRPLEPVLLQYVVYKDELKTAFVLMGCRGGRGSGAERAGAGCHSYMSHAVAFGRIQRATPP